MMGEVTMPLDRVQVIVEHLLSDGSRMGLILGDELNRAMGASARRRAEREVEVTEPDEDEDEEGPTYHGIIRYTHVRCGYTTRKRGEMEILNDSDPACPKCSDNEWPRGIPSYAYGAMVWEQADGTIVETYSNGSEVTRWQPVRTHVQVYKSWTNAPDTGEWWIVPRPNTGDIDGSDNLIIGFDTYQQAIDAINSGTLRTTFAELCTDKDGIAWRDRNDPTYQTTTKGA